MLGISSFILEAWQKLHTARGDDGGAPRHSAKLAGMGMVGLGGEFADVDMPFHARGAPQQHGHGVAHVPSIMASITSASIIRTREP
jgi:hypothetical protein